MANKVYTAPELAFLIADSAQTPTAQITLANLATSSGRVSAQLDRGAGAHAAWYEWFFTFQLGSTGTMGRVVELYLVPGNGSNIVGEVGTVDAALVSDKRRNLLPLGVVQVDTTSQNTDITGWGVVWLPSRYLSLAVWNDTGVSLRNSGTAHRFVLIPIPDQVQDAA